MKPATYISVYVFVYIIEVCQSQEILPLIFNFRSFAYFFFCSNFVFGVEMERNSNKKKILVDRRYDITKKKM